MTKRYLAVIEEYSMRDIKKVKSAVFQSPFFIYISRRHSINKTQEYLYSGHSATTLYMYKIQSHTLAESYDKKIIARNVISCIWNRLEMSLIHRFTALCLVDLDLIG